MVAHEVNFGNKYIIFSNGCKNWKQVYNISNGCKNWKQVYNISNGCKIWKQVYNIFQRLQKLETSI